jgi:tRNA(Ile)-lysidine synthase
VLARVRETIKKERLFQTGDCVVVAVSGGLDSMVLFDVLCELAEEWRLKLVVAHVDHGLRGEDSARDALFVKERAQARGVPFYEKKADVAAYARERKLSTQVAAREVRYAFLAEVAQKVGAVSIATAHHADDQAETVLMRVLRGTSMRGLAGIPVRRPAEDGLVYVRPLLKVWRSEIMAYARERGIVHREDASNASVKYLRNKIRIQLLPRLAEEYNAGVKTALVQLAELAREDDLYLMQEAEKALTAILTKKTSNIVAVDGKRLAVMPLPLQRRVITLILYYLRGNTSQWEQIHIESVRSLLENRYPSSRVSLPDGLTAWREYDLLVLGERRALPDAAGSVQLSDVLTSAGVHTLTAYGFTFVARVEDGVPSRGRDRWVVQFDADELSGSSIYIRTWVTGDVMRPLGLSGTKKLSDVFIDAKVPKSERLSWPLLVIDDEIAWAVGLCRGAQAPITAKTQRTLIVHATPTYSISNTGWATS